MNVLQLTSPHERLSASPRAVALGLFDGVHLGHRRVIMQAVGLEGLTAAVFTFDRAAAKLKTDAFALCSEARTRHLFEQLGVDEWLCAAFDAYRELSPEAFVADVLVGQLGAKHVVCGFNFRFGKNGAGDTDMLRTLCAQYGVKTTVVEEVADEHGTISSARIRRLIENGEVEEASRLLGHPVMIDGEVVHGQALGRTLRFPTVNQLLAPDAVRPRFGVYASTVVIDGVTYYGVTNVGVRPTVGTDTPLAETWIEDFDGDLYGRQLQVVLTHFLREEARFDSVDALKAQIGRDRRNAKALREESGIKAVLFDFDDTLQHRETALRQYAAFFMNKYLPDATPEEHAAATEHLVTKNNGGYVHYPTFFEELPRELGVNDPPSSAELFAEYQRIFPNFAHLFDDAAATLKALRDKGYRLGVVTNGPMVQQHRKLDTVNIRPLVDTVLVSAEEGVHKPDPELFRRAAARLGLSPAQCVFVGDHPVNDIEGALKSGMNAVMITTRCETDEHGVPTVETLSDLLDIL